MCTMGGRLLLGLLLVVMGTTTAYYRPYRPRCGNDRPQLPNGHYILENAANNVIKAVCDSGFQLQGAELRFCDVNTGYSGDPPSCQDVDECKLFEEMRASDVGSGARGSGERGSGSGDRPDESSEQQPCHVNATCTNVPHSYRCVCNEGFYGSGYQCSVLPCPMPTITNAASVRRVGQGNVIYVTCPQYHYRRGSEQIRCDVTRGKWLPSIPKCIPYPTCPEPIPMDHGSVNYKSQDVYLRGAAVGVECRDGYRLVGSSTWICGRGFVWTGQAHTYCEKMGLHRMGDALKAKLDRAAKNSASTVEYNEHARFSPYHPKGVNIVFVIDTSSSMLSSHIEKGIKFFSLIIRELHSLEANDHNTTGITRFAAVSFATEGKAEFTFADTANDTADQTIQRLNNIVAGGGGTNIKAGLDVVNRMLGFQNKAIRNAMHIIFTLSDGEADTMEGLKTTIDGLYKRDMEMFAIGVGAFARKDQLAMIASAPVYDHLFMLHDFQELTTLTNYLIDKRNVSQTCGLMGKRTDDPKLSTTPWSVLVEAGGGQDRTKYCGGSLICDNWVLTSANCVHERPQLKVTLGINKMDDQTTDRLEVEVEQKVPHPGYNSRFPHVDDLVLLRLKTPVPLSRTARTVCTPHESSVEVQTMKPWTIDYVKNTGWGITQDKMQLLRQPLHTDKTQFRSTDECKEVLNKLNMTDPNHQANLACLQSHTKTCSGDVGGSVVWGAEDEPVQGQNKAQNKAQEDTEYYLVGVPTYNSDCRDGGYTVVTKLRTYLDWIWTSTGQCASKYGAKKLAPE